MQRFTIAEKLTKKLNTISLKDNEVIVAVPLPVRLRLIIIFHMMKLTRFYLFL